MPLSREKIGWRFGDNPYGISGRRIWEHLHLGQLNPFVPITRNTAHHPALFVDIATVSSPPHTLCNVTLQQLRDGESMGLDQASAAQLLVHCDSVEVHEWLKGVEESLVSHLRKKAVRNRPKPYLPEAALAPLGIEGIHCNLADWLTAHGNDKQRPKQWVNRIQNLAQKGLKQAELDAVGVIDHLHTLPEIDDVLDGMAIRHMVDYRDYRLSILPVVNNAASHITWEPVAPDTKPRRLKPKLKGAPASYPEWHDPILGYWIDQVAWSDILGSTQGWVALTHRGKPIVSALRPTGLCISPQEAKNLAHRHAEQTLPKLSDDGDYASFRLTGGASYREWLVTMPFYPPSFASQHFAHRNVLLHLRTDIREGLNNERVLFVQELQSDWAQQARRQQQDSNGRFIPKPPWLQEWTSLGLKLLLLHAAHLGMDALAWTTGAEQVERYHGAGEEGLITLYDHTLPKEANRLLKAFGLKVESMDIYVPANFLITPTGDGYEVVDDEGVSVGRVPTWFQAQSLIPDGAHEILKSIHSVRLNASVRGKILASGFPAWGHRIQ